MQNELVSKLTVLVLLLVLGFLVYNYTQEKRPDDVYIELKKKYTSSNTVEGFINNNNYNNNYNKHANTTDIYQEYIEGGRGHPYLQGDNTMTTNAISDTAAINDTKENILNLLLTGASISEDNDIINDIEYKNLDYELILNTFGFITKYHNPKLALSLHNYKCNSNVKMINNINMVVKVQLSKWKVIEGLGDGGYISFYNIDRNEYLGRLSDGSIHCLDIDLGHPIERAMASFKLMDGLLNKNSMSLQCMPINDEKHLKVVSYFNMKTGVEDNILNVVALDTIINEPNKSKQTIMAKCCQFNLVDIITGKSLIQNRHHLLEHLDKEDTIYKNTSSIYEGFSSSNSTSNGGRSKTSRDKRNIYSFRKEGVLSNNEINIKELFTSPSPSPSPSTGNTNTKGKGYTGNIFKENTGSQFDKVLNKYIKTHKDDLNDNIFEKIENSKMDPNVQNLLDFNEDRFNIYQKENMEFSEKIDNKLNNNTNMLDTQVKDLNNYRIDKLAEELFLLQDELDIKRGIKN